MRQWIARRMTAISLPRRVRASDEGGSHDGRAALQRRPSTAPPRRARLLVTPSRKSFTRTHRRVLEPCIALHCLEAIVVSFMGRVPRAGRPSRPPARPRSHPRARPQAGAGRLRARALGLIRESAVDLAEELRLSPARPATPAQPMRAAQTTRAVRILGYAQQIHKTFVPSCCPRFVVRALVERIRWATERSICRSICSGRVRRGPRRRRIRGRPFLVRGRGALVQSGCHRVRLHGQPPGLLGHGRLHTQPTEARGNTHRPAAWTFNHPLTNFRHHLDIWTFNQMVAELHK